MTAFTIFFCGTQSNSYDFANTTYHQGELISTLARNHTGKEFVDWIICDGPGSGNLQEAEKWVPSGNYSFIRGNLFGSGWEENVQHAVAVLLGITHVDRTEHTRGEEKLLRKMGVGVHEEPGRLWGTRKVEDSLHARISPQALQAKKKEIFGKNKPIDCVNAIGWSRGAVTCHMLANALAETEGWSHIPVNIFACDPVPGTGQFQSDRIQLKGNVRDYVAIYAQDERSVGFTPVLPLCQPNTKSFITTIPGRHSTLVGNAAVDGATGFNCLFGPGLVTRDMAEKYLSQWGATLDQKLNFSDVAILQQYDEMLRQDGTFRKMQNKSLTFFTQKGPRPVGLGDGTSGSLQHDPHFVNGHHRALFAARYPVLYRDLFEGSGTRKRDLDMQIFNVKMMYPNLYKMWFGK